MGINDVNLFWRKPRVSKSLLHALRLPFRIRQNKVGRVAVHAVADDFAVNFSAASFGVGKAFQGIHAPALGNDDTVSVDVERTGRFRRVFVTGKRVLRVERRENTERMNTFRNAASQSKVDFAQTQLLNALN